MGGDIVPAVVCVSLSVVSVTSMIVAVAVCTGSYLVGVVIVVYSALCMRKSWKFCVSLRKSMFKSPCSVIDV